MTQYATYFSSPIKVGTAIDNLQPGIGDVVLSQNLQLANAAGSSGYILLPIGSDLQEIDFNITNGFLPTAGVISIFLAQADGSGQTAGPVVTLSTATGVFNTAVVFNSILANVYIIPVPYRLIFTTTTAVAGTTAPSVVAQVRYCIRGA